MNLKKGEWRLVMYVILPRQGKAKQHNVMKISDHFKSKVVGEIMFLDLSFVKPPKKGVVIPQNVLLFSSVIVLVFGFSTSVTVFYDGCVLTQHIHTL
jgi:hypothetical protein